MSEAWKEFDPSETVEREVLKPGRIQSVDLLRGLTIALMILVNDPGDWSHTFSQLDHAAWNGFTLTDFVFPNFLFLVGASTIFSLEAREAKGDCRKTLAGHVLWRALKLFLLKTVLSLIPYFHWHTMRIYGVLTRIALCYAIAGLVLLATRKLRTVAVLVATILVGYWVLLRWVHVPGCGWPVHDFPLLDKYANLTAWVDRGVSHSTLAWIKTGTLYEKTRDPEGLLSTLPAVATTLLGAMAGLWMRHPHEDSWGNGRRGMLTSLAAVAGGCVAVGLVWAHWFPLNKNLWTSSYVLVAGGLSALALVVCSLLVDERREPWPRWLKLLSWPWFVFGANAIAAFTTSVLLVKICSLIKVKDAAGNARSLWWHGYHDVFARHGSNNWTSMGFAMLIVLICFLPNWLLWRKKVFLKI